MSFTTILAINLGVLAMVLLSDLGSKAVTKHRLRRPLITAVIIGGSFFEKVPSGGSSELLIAAGVGIGVLLGLVASSLLRVDADHEDGVVRTFGGAGYAALWVAVIGARVAFSYGADHWFTASLTRFCIDHQITGAAITDALILMALAMVVTRTAVLAARVSLTPATAAQAKAHAAA
ncbi:MAG: hypothetical protein AAGC46_11890 [Solirubrobacteraceae bacterium]|nr:hypothetical protein [Patulibacter sp.]